VIWTWSWPTRRPIGEEMRSEEMLSRRPSPHTLSLHPLTTPLPTPSPYTLSLHPLTTPLPTPLTTPLPPVVITTTISKGAWRR
jgi:hypothetical protein